ncbi:baseplate J/gp47 family protein [Fredinandcohnia humi]
MAFENQIKEEILQRMLDTIPSEVDKRQGSIVHDLISPSAIELELTYIEMDNVLNWGFAGTTYGDYLDRRVAEVGLTRKPALSATGTLTFTGPDGTYIPVGTECSTDSENPIYFVTTSDAIISNGTATVNAEAKEGGASGNVTANVIVLVLGDLTNLSVTNTSSFEGGLDEESDALLLARYYERVRKPATSGNKNHYVQWATEVTGVGAAKVFPLWNGKGTVKVVIVDSNYEPATQALVDTVQNYIDPADFHAYGEGKAPIGATVTVESATTRAIDLSVTLTLASGATLEQATAEVQQAFEEYLRSIAFVETTVRYSRIGNLVLTCPSVDDYANLTINGVSENISLLETEIPVKGLVNIA